MFKFSAAIGVDIARFSLRIAVVNARGEAIAEKVCPLDQKQTKEYLLSCLFGGIHDIRKTVSSNGINPICIGIAAKGFIDHQTGVVLGPDQGIKDWKNVPLAKVVKKETGLPVFVGNDANLMTVAEQRFGAARNYNNVIFVALRTGIGGGIIINGKLYRGLNNAGGEVGQMIINFADGISDKGIRGSFEHFASASALVRRYCEETGYISRRNKNIPTCKEIFELSYKKDPVAVRIVKENAYLVGIGLANLISIFAPEIIVLGGGMSDARESYIKMIKRSAFANSLENCRAKVKIERAKLGPKAAFIGAAFYSLLRLAGKPI
ncbi:MAG: ROK family protein [Bacteroidales bacterium]|nr:ROK family protein [Bacteroidales bacterium]